MTRKQQREAAYLSPTAGLGHLSFDLVVSAKAALQRSLDDRRGPVVRLSTNHYTPNAVATIVLVTTALDVSMNEAIAMGAVFGATVERDLALPPVCRKLASVASASPGFDNVAAELRLLVDVRDEIVHYLPRMERSTGNVPDWCQSLRERGLFIEAPSADFQFSQKIPSYALAYWAYGTAFEALRLFIESMPEVTRRVCDYLVHNFGLYQDVCPPEAMWEYDAAYQLELTQFEAGLAGPT